jgi:hypothetical protein
VAQALLSAHGFDASMIASLVNQGMATITAEKVRVRAGGTASLLRTVQPQGSFAWT